MGEARRALARLLTRIEQNPGEPESFTGLVQVLRFCGLLRESIAAHKRAIDLDPTVVTSVPHTLFLDGDYAASIETYGGRASYYLDAAAWAALGDKLRASALLGDRLARMSLSELMKGLMTFLLALLQERFDDAFHCMEAMRIPQEPEILVYLARHYSYIGSPDSSIKALKRAAQSGFVCAPGTLRSDAWLGAARRSRLRMGLPKTPSMLYSPTRYSTQSCGCNVSLMEDARPRSLCSQRSRNAYPLSSAKPTSFHSSAMFSTLSPRLKIAR